MSAPIKIGTLKASQPIGIFDSGIGGLTVAKAITQLLPKERIIYFGDTAHMPYGDKSRKSVQHYSDIICDFLLEKDCKLIVIACNTASAASYRMLQKRLGNKIPIISVIEPVVKAVATNDSINCVGIIGTKGTIRSGAYRRKMHKARKNLDIRSQATPLLAPMVEEGFFNNNISQTIINTYLSKSSFSPIQGLILACTHYPLIRKEIEQYYQGKVKLYDSTDIVPKTVKQQLEKYNLLSNNKEAEHVFYISDYTDSFEKTTKIFYREKIHLEHCPIWD